MVQHEEKSYPLFSLDSLRSVFLSSNHMAFKMANEHASPKPNTQEKYHILLSFLEVSYLIRVTLFQNCI